MQIVTDNGGPFKKALAWLEEKYGIRGIQISAYNSRANGKVERPHCGRLAVVESINGTGTSY